MNTLIVLFIALATFLATINAETQQPSIPTGIIIHKPHYCNKHFKLIAFSYIVINKNVIFYLLDVQTSFDDILVESALNIRKPAPPPAPDAFRIRRAAEIPLYLVAPQGRLYRVKRQFGGYG